MPLGFVGHSAAGLCSVLTLAHFCFFSLGSLHYSMLLCGLVPSQGLASFHMHSACQVLEVAVQQSGKVTVGSSSIHYSEMFCSLCTRTTSCALGWILNGGRKGSLEGVMMQLAESHPKRTFLA